MTQPKRHLGDMFGQCDAKFVIGDSIEMCENGRVTWGTVRPIMGELWGVIGYQPDFVDKSYLATYK